MKQGRKSGDNSRGRRGGYTLIEMAISIIIVGVLTAPALAVYGNYKVSAQRQATLDNIQSVVTAIQNYRALNGAYPCPAPLNIPRTNSNYGQDACTAAVTSPITTVNPAVIPNCVTENGVANAVCVEQSVRAGLAGTAQRVIVGAVPFRELQLDENLTYDGYGSRIEYVVTQSQTALATVNDLNGAISVQSALPLAAGSALSLVSPADSAIFLVFSTGPTKVGGVTRDGVIAFKCTGAAGLDVTNCNKKFEGGVISANPYFIYSYENRAAGANFYDDQMSYFSSHTDPLWARIPGSLNDIHDLTTAGVGIGVASPFSAGGKAVALDVQSTGGTNSLLVSGNMLVGTKGAGANIPPGCTAGTGCGALANKYGSFQNGICDENGANCFNPELIAGNWANSAIGQGMKCPVGTPFMNGIVAGAPDCQAVRVGCSAPTQVLNGFTFDGTSYVPNCTAPPNPACLADPAHVVPGASCGTVNLVAGADTTQQSFGPISTTAPAGCKHVTFTCNSATWNETADDGNPCTFTSSCTTTNGLACPIGYQGNYSSTSCTNCGAPPTVTTTQATACTCAPAGSTTSSPIACTAPWTGNQTQTISWDGACNVTYGTFSGCTCGLSAGNQPVACGPGYDTGMASQPVGVNAGTCTYFNNGPVDYSGCSCSITGSRTIGASCAPGYIGGQQDQNVVGCAWTNVGSVYGCTCDTSGYPQYSYVPHNCDSTTPVTYTGGSNCNYPDPSATTNHQDEWTKTINAGTCVTSGPTFDGNYGVCLPITTMQWVLDADMGGSQGNPNGIYINQPCSCTDKLNTLATDQICYNNALDRTQNLCKCR